MEQEHATPAVQRPWLTLRQAAQAAGVSQATMRRALDAHRFPQARRDDDGAGAWLIPVDDLLAAGFRLNAPEQPAQDGRQGHALPHEDLLTQLRKAERRAVIAELRASAAETLAAERERSLNDLRLALHALTRPRTRPRRPQRRRPGRDGGGDATARRRSSEVPLTRRYPDWHVGTPSR